MQCSLLFSEDPAAAPRDAVASGRPTGVWSLAIGSAPRGGITEMAREGAGGGQRTSRPHVAEVRSRPAPEGRRHAGPTEFALSAFDLDKPHTLEDDFAHFLAYQNWSQLPAEEIERLRLAYEHGRRRGSALPKPGG